MICHSIQIGLFSYFWYIICCDFPWQPFWKWRIRTLFSVPNNFNLFALILSIIFHAWANIYDMALYLDRSTFLLTFLMRFLDIPWWPSWKWPTITLFCVLKNLSLNIVVLIIILCDKIFIDIALYSEKSILLFLVWFSRRPMVAILKMTQNGISQGGSRLICDKWPKSYIHAKYYTFTQKCTILNRYCPAMRYPPLNTDQHT